MRRVSATAVFLTVLAIIAYPTPSYAYLDPGTGSLVLQTIVGAIVAVSVGLGAMRYKITAFFKKLSGKKDGAASLNSDR